MGQSPPPRQLFPKTMASAGCSPEGMIITELSTGKDIEIPIEV